MRIEKEGYLLLCVWVALCLPLMLTAQNPNCTSMTAKAAFSDWVQGSPAGIRGDGKGDYVGLQNADVGLLTGYDHDFVLDTRDNHVEKAAKVDRKVTLDFGANNSQTDLSKFGLPFAPFQVDALIRVDEVYMVGIDPVKYPNNQSSTRLILWFGNYRLYFDSGTVSVTGNASRPRHWVIESTYPHVAWLQVTKGMNNVTIGTIKMPVQITVDEIPGAPPSCI
jgi:hypothetical protein